MPIFRSPSPNSAPSSRRPAAHRHRHLEPDPGNSRRPQAPLLLLTGSIIPDAARELEIRRRLKAPDVALGIDPVATDRRLRPAAAARWTCSRQPGVAETIDWAQRSGAARPHPPRPRGSVHDTLGASAQIPGRHRAPSRRQRSQPHPAGTGPLTPNCASAALGMTTATHLPARIATNVMHFGRPVAGRRACQSAPAAVLDAIAGGRTADRPRTSAFGLLLGPPRGFRPNRRDQREIV